ncbi:ead/Ea22-like family protein [Pseudomonas sp. Marseille-QA0892]
MTTKWDELECVAKKATPGPWWVDSHGMHMVSKHKGWKLVFTADNRMGPATRHPETGGLSHWPNDWDATFIAQANPAAVQELIAEVKHLTEENDRVRAANLEGVDWVNAARADIDQLTQRLNETLEKHRATFSQLEQKGRECEELRKDAGRGRWLRDMATTEFLADLPEYACVDNRNKMIDAAMAKEGASNG